ncbi:glycosyltransferase [bacterium]|nr:glycosyltransferase [bacterium]
MNSQPRLSIVLAVFDAKLKYLDTAIHSVEEQYYSNWELCIVDDGTGTDEVTRYLAAVTDERIKRTTLSGKSDRAEVLNAGLAMASAPYVGFLKQHDSLSKDALVEVLKALDCHDPDFVYSDEDFITAENKVISTDYKPDFSPETLLSFDYIRNLAVYKSELLQSIGGFREGFGDAERYDMKLRATEQSNRVHHIQVPIYHSRVLDPTKELATLSGPLAHENGKRAVEDALKRRGIAGTVENGFASGIYRAKRTILGEPLVSIVVAFRDKPDLLQTCIESILDLSTYSNFEIIGINNDSQDSKTLEAMESLKQLDERVRILDYNVPFNYSRINNYGVSLSRGEHVVLLNNDTEIISRDWIESLLEHSQREDVGAVGAKLFYECGKVQHAGVIVGLGTAAGHSHKHIDGAHPGYFNRASVIQNISAVTAACLMTKRRLFDELGGLNEENLKVAFNDTDFCLRLMEAGYMNIMTPHCQLYHYESRTRGADDTIEKRDRFESESEFFQERHKEILDAGDPFYNKNLPLDTESFGLLKTRKRRIVSY